MKVISLVLVIFINIISIGATDIMCFVDYTTGGPCTPTSTFQATCSKISDCNTWAYNTVNTYLSVENTYIYIQNTGSSGYNRDCPELTYLPASNSITFQVLDGYTVIDCQGNRFLSLTMTNYTYITFSNIGFTNSNATGNQYGLFDITYPTSEASPTISFINANVSNIKSVNSGGFLRVSDLNVNIVGSNFTNCYSAMEGGVIKSDELSFNNSVYIQDSTFTSNGAYQFGGAISAPNVYVLNSQFTKNSVISFGGAVYSTNSFVSSYSTYISNHAANGGSVYAQISLIDNSVFNYSSVSYDGGALYSFNSTINNSTFFGNYAKNSGGSIVSFYSIGMESTSVLNSSAGVSGGGLLANGVVNIIHCDFDYNIGGYGGAIYLNNGNTLSTILNARFRGNTGDSGGAIVSGHTEYNIFIMININNNTNYAVGYYYYFMLTEFNNNVAHFSAGAIFFYLTPYEFYGGYYINSTSNSNPTVDQTFNSEALPSSSLPHVFVEKILLTNGIEYYTPLVQDRSSQYVKAYGTTGNCVNGIAEINVEGDVINCKCFKGYKGPACGQHSLFKLSLDN
ncbi:hypothetical protein PPL_11779 [Heterostelium album PN500]|uniref:EGF-like domain-containing protein n=1 Tax=Heterostelium pallidum (strain ATCC 26659 / Pp 5 / PN500) TaxID=670386 RepID=D3BUF9_HETP5|nr:hypothetical protein PPL_11779 [Heterostelium album PN500]EFA74747.1 hypothetical protein PPL_11779 [Heterostelium album PN500]|eukprot:XP_020426881.1 hypothetical protein PPL_11779 [Heterostelium album PN500]